MQAKTPFEEADLDQELGLGRSVSHDHGEGEDTDTDEVEESQYSISRSKRISTVITESVSRLDSKSTCLLIGNIADRTQVASTSTKLRSAESYQAFVRDESQITRRVGAIGAASVVSRGVHEPATSRGGFASRPHLTKQKATGGSSSSGGSILLSKTGKFA